MMSTFIDGHIHCEKSRTAYFNYLVFVLFLPFDFTLPALLSNKSLDQLLKKRHKIQWKMFIYIQLGWSPVKSRQRNFLFYGIAASVEKNWEFQFWDYQKQLVNLILKQWLLGFILVIVQDNNCLDYRANLFHLQVNRKIPNNLSRRWLWLCMSNMVCIKFISMPLERSKKWAMYFELKTLKYWVASK